MNETRSEIILAAGFLTRLPLPTVEYSEETMARATRWYALVGLVIGLVLAAIFWALATILPQVLAALMTIAAAMLLTGALHEDGLADIADGLGGSADRTRAMEIMRDSRIGTYGVLALGVTLASKVTALALLPLPAALAALIAGHTLGRLSMTWLMRRLDYARSDGAASFMSAATSIDDKPLWVVAALAMLPVFWLAGLSPLFLTLFFVVGLISLIASRLKARLGGYTGDALGASEQLCEALVPIVILACL